MTQLLVAGCREGLINECRMATYVDDTSSKIFALGRICTLTANDCEDYYRYLDQLDPLKAMEALERGCQHDTDDSQVRACQSLAMAYLRAIYSEPVPGRGQALAEWVCARSSDPAECLRDFAALAPVQPAP